MLIEELGKEQCEELLGHVGLWRLACSFENQPYLLPVYLAYAAGALYGFATMGQKIDWMRANPRVCVETDEVRSQTDWWSVLIQGRFEEFPDTGSYAVRRQEAQALLEKETPLWWKVGVEAAQTRQRFDRNHAIFFCIHVDQMTGRKALPDPA
ncbi:MAG: pyridoxamine 5'-phosphate oxidase family protein [Acidobacteriaceae bacterium]|jgi:nitroimidazol reductase NimA-like FMN-containing flavoprotein (pyridoxamine 5'-phosphate oxidase superfamily)